MTFLSGATSIFPLELRAIDSQDTWDNTIIKLASGAEQRNVNWSDSLRVFDASTAENLTIAQLNSVRKHFNAVRGSGFSFALRDRSLFQVTDEPFGTGGGIGSTNQLVLNDGVAANAYNREIYLPEQGTIVIKANTVTKVENTDYTIAYSGATAGLVTWLTSVSGQTLTWTGNFYLPVRYAIKSFPSAELFIWQSSGVGVVKGPSIGLEEVRYLSEV